MAHPTLLVIPTDGPPDPSCHPDRWPTLPFVIPTEGPEGRSGGIPPLDRSALSVGMTEEKRRSALSVGMTEEERRSVSLVGMTGVWQSGPTLLKGVGGAFRPATTGAPCPRAENDPPITLMGFPQNPPPFAFLEIHGQALKDPPTPFIDLRIAARIFKVSRVHRCPIAALCVPRIAHHKARMRNANCGTIDCAVQWRHEVRNGELRRPRAGDG